MATTCPCCGQIVYPRARVDGERVITSEDEVLRLLGAVADRDLFVSQTGSWHITKPGDDRLRVDPDVVASLVQGGKVRERYKGNSGCYTLGRTIDMEATLAERNRVGTRVNGEVVLVYAD